MVCMHLSFHVCVCTPVKNTSKQKTIHVLCICPENLHACMPAHFFQINAPALSAHEYLSGLDKGSIQCVWFVCIHVFPPHGTLNECHIHGLTDMWPVPLCEQEDRLLAVSLQAAQRVLLSSHSDASWLPLLEKPFCYAQAGKEALSGGKIPPVQSEFRELPGVPICPGGCVPR
jgi:hypothetical protein